MMGLEQLLKEGERIYLQNKEDLESKYLGQYIVIDPETAQYLVDESKLAAYERAQEQFGLKLFYISRVGEVGRHERNYRQHGPSWVF